MVNQNPVIDPRYGYLPVDDLVDESIYAQPIRTVDTDFRLQVMTPYSDDAWTIHEYYSDIQVQNVPLVPITPALLNQPFVCLNGIADWTGITPGTYYTKYTYTDENNVVQDIRSNPIDLQVDFLDYSQIPPTPTTFVYEATHTFNAFGVVFTDAGSPVTFAYRFQGSWYNPLVKSITSRYNDEYNNPTQENSIPYVTRTNYLGNEHGVPFWVVEKVNLLMSLNSVKINGEYFTKLDDDFKPNVPANQAIQNGYWEINVQKVYNYNFTQYKTGLPPPNTFKVITLSLGYPGNTGAITIPNVFKNRFRLVGIQLTNNSAAYQMEVGTNAPVSGVYSNDVASIPVASGNDFYLINHVFGTVKTVYIGIPPGTSADVDVEYIDETAPNYVPPSNTSKWVENTLYDFIETSATVTFADAFNAATGNGMVGTDWEDCILVGSAADVLLTRGVPLNLKGRTIRVWDNTKPLERETVLGADTVLITRATLPNYSVKTRVTLGASNNGGSPNAIAVSQSNGSGIQSFPFVDLNGGGQPLMITNPSVILAKFYYKP